ncbi:MAG: response regulator transcription factor [Actinobacteria bacterium]|nr:response regulator transcription factor [Actinomycetota bacterium]
MRLLVVEDEVRLAQALQRGLAAEGFEVEVAHDGLTGLSLAMEGRYDAIVLDILLPGMNGYKVCAEIRAAGNWTPILMLTAKSGEYDEAEALDTGADDFLSKPFSYVVLVARLRALVRRGAGARPVPCQVGDLRLDPAARTCDRDGVPIHLTPREVDLLEALMSRPGEVVSKQELLDRVWGPDSGVDPNVVEVYLGYLRRKIDRPFDRETLLTVRGAGYLLADA